MIWGHTRHKNQGDLDEFPVPHFGHHGIYIYIIHVHIGSQSLGFLCLGATEIHPTWHQKLHLDAVDG